MDDLKAKVVKLSFFFLITVCCFCQIFKICLFYFKYPTNVQIKTEFDVFEIPVPAITFCANIGNKSRGKTSEELFKTFHINESDVEISFHFNNKEFEINGILKNAIESWSLKYYCFTLITGNLTTKLIKNDWIRFKIEHFDTENSWWVSVHHPDDLPSSYEWNSIEVLRYQSYSLTFTIKSYHLLRSPYKTDCRQYVTETEFKSRKDCIRKCKLSITQTHCGIVSHEVDVYRGEPSVRFADSVEDENCVNRLNVKRKCLEMCPHYDCFKQYIVPMIVSQLKMNSTEVSISFPTKPQTTYKHKPRIELIEFVCYVASALSIWFGVSVYSIYNWTETLFKRTQILILKKPIFTSNVLIVKSY